MKRLNNFFSNTEIRKESSENRNKFGKNKLNNHENNILTNFPDLIHKLSDD